MKHTVVNEPSSFAAPANSRGIRPTPRSRRRAVASWPEAEERLSRRCLRMIAQFEKDFSFDGGTDPDMEKASQALAALDAAILSAPALTMGALKFKLQLIRRTPSAWRTPEETDDLLALLASDVENVQA